MHRRGRSCAITSILQWKRSAPLLVVKVSGRMPFIILAKAQICTNITNNFLVTTELARIESRSTFQELQLCFSCTSEKSSL